MNFLKEFNLDKKNDKYKVFEHAIKGLKFLDIIDQIKSYAFTDYAKKLIDRIKFFTDYNDLKIEIEKVESIYNLLFKGINFHLFDFTYIEEYILKIEKGYILNGEELNLLKRFIQFYFNFKNIYFKYKEYLTLFFSESDFNFDFKQILLKIDKKIDENGNVKDDASEELKKLNGVIEKRKKEIYKTLDKLILKYSQENLLTEATYIIKNNRYLLLVKPGKRKKVNGILHELSSTKKTAFIEPFEIIEINNHLAELLSERESEIYKILRDLATFILSYIEDLKVIFIKFIIFDFYHAKAKFSYLRKFTKPEISKQTKLKLINFYHPFVIKPVKNSIEIWKEKRIIIISGPNTGGKTVLLKAIGIIVLLFLNGNFIPADYGSEIPIFNKLFIDIGDEQSIQNNLSSFSSHILNIKYILENSDNNTLVLLDELGTATSPEEGEALSCAIVERLVKTGVFGLITSHFKKLKMLFLKYNEIRNGSMEFDINNLTPTYRFIVDVPGSSYGFYIAEKLGLDSNIISNARKWLKEDNKLEDLIIELQSLIKENRELNTKQKELKNTLKDELKKIENLKNELNKEKKKIKKQYKQQLFDEVKNLKKIVERRISILKKHGYDRKKVKELIDIIDIKKNKLEKDLNFDNFDEKEDKESEELKIGDIIEIKGTGKIGEIIDIEKNKYHIKVDNLKFVLSKDKIRKQNINNSRVLSEQLLNSDKNSIEYNTKLVKNEIDLRGLTKEQAYDKLEEFFDSLIFTNYEKVYIIHGKGEGKLQEFVHNYLKNNTYVFKYEFAPPEEGGTGCTVVYLRI